METLGNIHPAWSLQDSREPYYIILFEDLRYSGNFKTTHITQKYFLLQIQLDFTLMADVE